MYPKITVVTPSYNQATFIEQTIQSVIGQQYPNLEYIIMDGGSSDDSAAIIKRYEKHLAHWESQVDNGQAAAINKGFAMATGDILCWLNSDDMYLPGALFEVARQLKDGLQPSILFGNCLHFQEGNPDFSRGSNVRKKHARLNIRFTDYIIQPSSFLTRQAFSMVGALDERYHYVFDWEWFIRAKELGVEHRISDNFLSLYRIHSMHKTGTGGDHRQKEIETIYQRFNSKKDLQALQRVFKMKKIFTRWHLPQRLLKFEKLIYFFFFRDLVSFDGYQNIKRVN